MASGNVRGERRVGMFRSRNRFILMEYREHATQDPTGIHQPRDSRKIGQGEPAGD